MVLTLIQFDFIATHHLHVLATFNDWCAYRQSLHITSMDRKYARPLSLCTRDCGLYAERLIHWHLNLFILFLGAMPFFCLAAYKPKVTVLVALEEKKGRLTVFVQIFPGKQFSEILPKSLKWLLKHPQIIHSLLLNVLLIFFKVFS